MEHSIWKLVTKQYNFWLVFFFSVCPLFLILTMEQFNTSDFQANSRIPVLKRIERCCKAINTLILIFGDLINEANNTHFEGEDVKILGSFDYVFHLLYRFL